MLIKKIWCIRIRRSLTFCKRWHFDWINGLVLSKEKRTNWNITHLSIMDKLYYISQLFKNSFELKEPVIGTYTCVLWNQWWICLQLRETTVTLKVVGYIFSRYQIWNRIIQRSTRGFWKVLFKFLVNKISGETFCEVSKYFINTLDK